MSYLLDALQKSQDARDSDSTPGPPTGIVLPGPGSKRPEQRSHRQLLLSVIAFVFIAGVAYLWLSNRPSPAKGSTLQAPATAPAPPIPGTSQAPIAAKTHTGFMPEASPDTTTTTEVAIDEGQSEAREAITESVLTDPAGAVAESQPASAVSSLDTEAPSVTAAVEAAMNSNEPVDDEHTSFARDETTVTGSSQPAPEVTGSAPLQADTPQSSAEPVAENIQTLDEGQDHEEDQRAQSQVQAESEAAAPPPIPHLKSLPPNIQQAIGRINFSVHFYSAQPERRFVIINGRRYREDQQIDSGAQIESIVASGVIFSYEDYQFWVPNR